MLELEQVREALIVKGIGFEEASNGDLILGYSCDGAMLKLSPSIGIGNGYDGHHNLIVTRHYPDGAGAYLKLEKFAFYKYDGDAEPKFEVDGWCTIYINEAKHKFEIYLKVI